MHAKDQPSFRYRTYLVLEGGAAAGPLSMAVRAFLVALIIANVVAYIFQSVPWVRKDYLTDLTMFEIFSIAVFAIEYLLRIWTAPEDPVHAAGGPIIGRLRYAIQPMMIVDLLAFAPSLVALIVPFVDLRILLLARLLRLLKIARYSPALTTLADVLKQERRALFGTVLLLICAMVFAASAMHAAEGHIQPDAFGTIPDSMWWAITTLTTVGYGDVVPATSLGRVIAAVTMVTGLGIFALPVGIVATGFVNMIHRRDFVVTFGMLARVPLFRGFDAQLLSEIMTMLRAESVSPGGIVSAQGERAATMYFVVTGTVEVRLHDRKIHFRSGDFFGEVVLLQKTMRAAMIVALDPCRLLTLSASDFERLIQRHPELQTRLPALAAEYVEQLAEEGGILEEEIAAAREVRMRSTT
ncbi:MAG TPA: cyclic nucleotide-gated ion channel [Rhizomicrobium sp.]|nr:cyclic nucleotide-gated ion channel [Rhizomicrobium sp.]